MTSKQLIQHFQSKHGENNEYAQIELMQTIVILMATYSPEVTLVRSAVVKGAPEITPGNRVTRDVMRVGLNDKPGTCSKHEDKMNGTTKKEKEGYGF